MRAFSLCLVLLVSGCATVQSSAPSTAGAPPAAYASEQDNPAKGTKSCYVSQVASAHRAALNGRSIETSELHVNVGKDGSIGIAVSADTYPRSKAYFLIDGKRYSGDGDRYVAVPLRPLKDEAVIQYTYTDWPYGGDHSSEDVIVGFDVAYEKCLAFLAR